MNENIIIITSLVIIYFVTILCWWFMTYFLNRDSTFAYGTVTLGDIIDETCALAYIPLFNIICGIISLIIIALCYTIVIIIAGLHLDTIWEKIRKIKIKTNK